MPETTPSETIRVDKWLWFARFCKTRSLASKLVAAGSMRLNGVRFAKASQSVRPGDVLTFPLGPHIRVIRVEACGVRRGPAPEAQTLYTDLDPPLPREKKPEPEKDARRDPGAGRPTKRDRRRMDQFRAGGSNRDPA